MRHRLFIKYAFRFALFAGLILTTFSASISELPAKTVTTQQTNLEAAMSGMSVG